MRLRTIWTIGGYSFNERLRNTGEYLLIRAVRALPERIKYQAYVEMGVRYIHPDEQVPAVYYIDVLQRIGKGR